MHGTDINRHACDNVRPAISRRDWLARAGGGFGALAAAYLLNGSPLHAAPAKLMTWDELDLLITDAEPDEAIDVPVRKRLIA